MTMVTFPVRCCGEIHCISVFDDFDVYLANHLQDEIESRLALHELGADLHGCIELHSSVGNFCDPGGGVPAIFHLLDFLEYPEEPIVDARAMRIFCIARLYKYFIDKNISKMTHTDEIVSFLSEIISSHGNDVPDLIRGVGYGVWMTNEAVSTIGRKDSNWIVNYLNFALPMHLCYMGGKYWESAGSNAGVVLTAMKFYAIANTKRTVAASVESDLYRREAEAREWGDDVIADAINDHAANHGCEV